MKKYIVFSMALILGFGANAASIDIARSVCPGIADGIGKIKIAAGVSVGTSAVGAVAGGVAAGAGFMKQSYDRQNAEKKNKAVNDLVAMDGKPDADIGKLKEIAEGISGGDEKEPAAPDAKSQTLGNVRTAGAFVSGGAQGVSAALAFIGMKQLDDLANDMDACQDAVAAVEREMTELRFSEPENPNIAPMQRIVDSCKGMYSKNIRDIKSKLSAAGIVSSIGGALGIAGGITSAIAVSKEKGGADATATADGGTAGRRKPF